MKEKLNSIRVRVWGIFVLFSFLIIGFLYVFQILMLPGFYEYMKIRETSQAVSRIKYTWNHTPENLNTVVTEVSSRNMVYIQVSDQNRVYARKSSIDKNNNEILTIISNLNESKMEKYGVGNDVYYTSTIPRNKYDSKAIVMAAQVNNTGIENPLYNTDNPVWVYVFNYLEPLGTTTYIINSQLTLASVIIIMCAFLLSVLFSNSISNPIIKIAKNAKLLPHGDFKMELQKYQFTEINDLTASLNSASEEIAKTDNLQKDLMANISHDLRTPLTMIKAYAEMIRDLSGNNPEKREQHLQVIIDETDRLTSLVTDILDLSKLQSGVAQMNYEQVDFSEHLKNLVSRFNLLNEIKDYKIELIAEDDIFIWCDITKIDQVIYNFINNAITYTGDDKTVKVRLTRTAPDKGKLEVIDSGIGIDKENLKYVWDRYYRVKKDGETHRRAKKGSGLGLAIVKGVLEMHKFNYGVESEVNKGSNFWFEFNENPPKENTKKHKKEK